MTRDRASRPEAKPLRLFAAVEIPEQVRAALAESVTPLRERFPKARWVPLENQHVTVKFLGSTWPRLAEWVPETVSSVAGRHERALELITLRVGNPPEPACAQHQSSSASQSRCSSTSCKAPRNAAA